MHDVDDGFEDVPEDYSSSSTTSSSSSTTTATQPEEAYDAKHLQLVSYKEAARVDDNGVLRTSSLSAPNMLLSGHDTGVTKLHFTHDGTLLVSASMGKGATFLWDLTSESGSPMTVDVWNGHSRPVLDLAQTTDGAHMLTACADTTVGVWALDSGKMSRRLRGHNTYVNAVTTCVPGGSTGGAATSSTKDLVASMDDEGVCLLWDLRSKEPVGDFQHEWPLTSCCFGMGGANMLFGAGLDNIVYQYDLRKGFHGHGSSVLRQYQDHTDTITGLSLSPCGSYVLSNGMDQKLIQWDVRPYVANEDNRVVNTYQGHNHNFEKLMLRCGWSADGKSIACGSSDAMVNIWNVERNEHVYALPGHRGTVTDVVFHPTEPVIASCGIDGQIFLGELEL
jgi:Prp8 binding protein